MEEKKPKDFSRAKTPEELVDILMETVDNPYSRECQATLWILFGDHTPSRRMEREASDRRQELYKSGLPWDEVRKQTAPMSRAAEKKFAEEEPPDTDALEQKVMKLLEERTNAKNSR